MRSVYNGINQFVYIRQIYIFVVGGHTSSIRSSECTRQSVWERKLLIYPDEIIGIRNDVYC